MYTVNRPTTAVYTLRLTEILFINDKAANGYHRKGQPALVLIVDDEDLITEMYKLKFVNEGYTVYTAADGCAALEVARRVKPDIVLTDIVMPRCNGWHLLTEIKKDPALRNTPVIALSNFDDEDQRERACELGALYFLVKSECLPKDLAALVKDVLAARRSAQVFNK